MVILVLFLLQLRFILIMYVIIGQLRYGIAIVVLGWFVVMVILV